MLLNEYLALKLEALRKQKNMSIGQLCKSACLSPETYRSIRKIKKKDTFIRILLVLLRALGGKPSEFFDDKLISDEVDIDYK